jgi:hypothetical protein
MILEYNGIRLSEKEKDRLWESFFDRRPRAGEIGESRKSLETGEKDGGCSDRKIVKKKGVKILGIVTKVVSLGRRH